jgi:RNA polymerase sigma-70 factor (ECF subfamily)
MDTEKIFREHQPLLFSLAYNMLGSVMDAEDCVQETFLRWHRACSSDTTEAIRSPRPYLCAIVTNLCIDHLRSARMQRESYVGVWLSEPVLTTDPDEQVEMAEILSVAFLRLLETLSPLERAVFLLRQVFDYDYSEIARMVGKSEQNCRQIVSRARQRMAERRPRYTVPSEQGERLVKRFVQASSSGNVEELLHLLAEDVVLCSDGGETLKPVSGAYEVAHLMVASAQRLSLDTQWRWQLAAVNKRPGVVVYAYGRLYAVFAFEFVDERIQEVDIIVNPDKLGHFQHGIRQSI